ncbi:hypothetical protein SMACR_08005 [Sordaria macrospora]|uniref:WGS project CABT00000000 data, contig 2.13 n=2 Tax=Sordaria macrospora TaxID=5147 RepID=F7VY59_SORMK|nr:uncharacterized protein SMAC_08005 [Sordaria macrospora k-hell]KAA8629368.1 hypothetical protein SMACR_08005 [Sordaria macrospora]WPJ62893.1 hypothetical protein SMAC4_08005 [Sordaria macrospora]CCC10453.1 unnamed protein product [Sordaria macrospora k-hell]
MSNHNSLHLRSNSPKTEVWNPHHSEERDAEPPLPAGLDEARLEAITDQILGLLAQNFPDTPMESMANMVRIMREAANGNADAFRTIMEHVMDAITQSHHPEDFGVRNPAPSYSGLPTEGDVTVELEVAVPEYRPPPPSYTEDSQQSFQPPRGHKRKREQQDEDGVGDDQERERKRQCR